MVPRVLDRGVERGPGLDEDLALRLGAARAARHLHELLEDPLPGAEVGDLERPVDVDDADAGDLREVEALGDHLGPHEDVDLPGGERGEGLVVDVLPAHRVGVHPEDAGLREGLLDGFLDLLGSLPAVAVAGGGAGGAAGGDRRDVVAEVAAEPRVGAVEGEGEAAVGAHLDVAAFGALEGRRMAAAVEVEEGLLVPFEPLLDGLAEAGRDGGGGRGVPRPSACPSAGGR